MLDWTEHDEIPERSARIQDDLNVTEHARICIEYASFPLAFLSICLSGKNLDVNDRPGTRAKMLRAALVRTEAALDALREAVAKLPQEQIADAPLDMVGFANDLMRGPTP